VSNSGTNKEEWVKNLRKSGLTLAEANRWVYGWSDPAMRTFWRDIMKTRPKESPSFTQKEAFKTVAKTVFGNEYREDREIELPHAAYLEIIEVVVEGVLQGHVATRSIKKTKPTRDELFHKARSEFKRLLQEDPEFSHLKHSKRDD